VAPDGQHGDGGDRERDGVEEDRRRGIGQRQHHGAQRGPGHHRALTDRRAQRIGTLQLIVGHQPRRACRHRGRGDRAGGGGQRGQHRREHDRQAGRGDERQSRHEHHARGIGAHHQRPAVVSVGQDTAQRAEHDDGQDPGGRGERHPGGRAGTAEDERQQGDVVEPVAQRRGGEGQQDEVEGAATREAAATAV
jgi:hypothetical protein